MLFESSNKHVLQEGAFANKLSIPITDPNEELPETPPGSPGTPVRRKGVGNPGNPVNSDLDLVASPRSHLRNVVSVAPTRTAKIEDTEEDNEPVGVSVDRFSRKRTSSIFGRGKGKSPQAPASNTILSARQSSRRRRSSHTKFEAWRLEHDLEDIELQEVRDVTTSICNERVSSQSTRKPRRSIELTTIAGEQEEGLMVTPRRYSNVHISNESQNDATSSSDVSQRSSQAARHVDENEREGVPRSTGDNENLTTDHSLGKDSTQCYREDTPKPTHHRVSFRNSGAEEHVDDDSEVSRRRTYGSCMLKNLAIATRRASALPSNLECDIEVMLKRDITIDVDNNTGHTTENFSVESDADSGISPDHLLQRHMEERLQLKSKDACESKARRDVMRRQLWNDMRASPDSPIISNRRPFDRHGSHGSSVSGESSADTGQFWCEEMGTVSVDSLARPALQRLARELIRDNARKDHEVEQLSVALTAAREHEKENADLRDALAEQRAWHNRLLLHVLEQCPDVLTRMHDP
eukprot:m.322406 g.322406  ORF g.322406 m.322406 type:complete len:523 (+) comp20350_c0_seq2:107-1675(+)